MDNNPIRAYYIAMKKFDQYIEKEKKKKNRNTLQSMLNVMKAKKRIYTV